MSSLPIEIFYNITNFLPNDDITDLMLMSRKFNALVTPRLQKIDQEMATMNQHIESFMPSPPLETNDEWISQLNLKRFEPIGTVAKKRMKDAFHNKNYLPHCIDVRAGSWILYGMSLERFDAATFLRILGALVSTPKFRQEYNISRNFAHSIACLANRFHVVFF